VGKNGRPFGRRLSDPEVIAFVRSRMRTQTASSRSRLLSELRHNGDSCEQARFRQLFEIALASK
jgi:hypothetical protein